MSEHKPLPWEVTEVGIGEFFLVKFEPGGDGWEHSVGEINCREDADFIVRACNAHDDLLAALVDLLGTEGDIHDGHCIHCGRFYGQAATYGLPNGRNCSSDDCPAYVARTAIAKATGVE